MEDKAIVITETVTSYKVNKDVLKIGQVIGYKVNKPTQEDVEVKNNYSDSVGVIEMIWNDRIEVFDILAGGHGTLWADSFTWRDIEILSDANHLLEAYKIAVCPLF